MDTVDAYDLALDVWTVETRIPTPRFDLYVYLNRFLKIHPTDSYANFRYHAGMVIVADKLYVIGGFHSDSLFESRAATAGLIECYDLRLG